MDITPEQARAELARRELVRRGVSLEKSPSIVEQLPDAAKNALLNLTTRMASRAKDLGTNPETMARVMPAALGTAGAVSPIPMGATLGTGTGQAIRDIALKTLDKPIPSGTQHIGELALSALGDVAALPMIKKPIYGRMIGKAEARAKIPQFPESLPRPGGAAATTKWIDDTRRAIVNGEIASDEPVILKQIKDQIDFIYKNKKDVPLSNADEGKLAMLSNWAQTMLNKAIPGRAEPAIALASSQKIPNLIGRVVRKTPGWAKLAVGAGLAGALGSDVARKIGSLNVGR